MKLSFRVRWFGRAVFLTALFVDWTAAMADYPPTGCTDISAVPVTKDVAYDPGITSLFRQFSPEAGGCASCHTTAAGPSGGLNLDPDDQDPDAVSPYGGIVNVPSGDFPDLNYVTPNRPELSFLFMKVNCDQPPSGPRMPLGLTEYFTPEEQALIYDWIAGGATIESTSTIFRGTFDIRGFFVDAIFKAAFEP